MASKYVTVVNYFIGVKPIQEPDENLQGKIVYFDVIQPGEYYDQSMTVANMPQGGPAGAYYARYYLN